MAQVYTRFVEVGRVCLINYGADNAKLAVVVDVLDHNRVLIDGPTSGIARQAYPLKRISLTSLKVEGVSRLSKTAKLKAAMEAGGIDAAFADTAWGKKLASRAKRASLTDFERHKVMVARKTRAGAVNAAYNKVKAK